MARRHQMMLSDLYGRIGQMLAEHGDAPIGRVVTPPFLDEPHVIADFIQPIYCDFSHVTTEMYGVKIKTYEPAIEE